MILVALSMLCILCVCCYLLTFFKKNISGTLIRVLNHLDPEWGRLNVHFFCKCYKHRGGCRNSGKGVRMYIDMGVCLSHENEIIWSH